MICCDKEMVDLGNGNYGCPVCGRMLNDLVYREYKSPSDGKENGTNNDGRKIDWTPENLTNSPFVSMPYEKPSIYQQGWVCPKCGAVMSPSTDQCPNCRPKNGFTC